MQGFLTVEEAARPENLNRSANWIRTGIKIGKVRATRVGRGPFVLTIEEVRRLKEDMPKIAKEDYSR